MAKLTENQVSEFEQLLLDEQAELMGVADLLSDSAGAVSLDQTAVGRVSRVDALQQQSMALASQQRQDERLVAIKEALERIDDNIYGECVECLDAIPVKRLEIDPSVACCINCAN